MAPSRQTEREANAWLLREANLRLRALEMQLRLVEIRLERGGIICPDRKDCPEWNPH